MPYAIQIRQTGGPEVLNWTLIEVGEPGSGQVGLRQAAAGLNYIDVYHRTGYYSQPLPLTSCSRSWLRESCALTSISALRSRTLQTPTRHWKRPQPPAPPF